MNESQDLRKKLCLKKKNLCTCQQGLRCCALSQSFSSKNQKGQGKLFFTPSTLCKKEKKKTSFMCLFKQLNTAALLYCRLSLIQHVAPQLLKRLHSWSEGGKSNYSAQPWWEKQSKDERKLDKQSKVDEGRRSISLFFPPAPRSWAGVLFLFVDCRALPQQQLLLLYPLLWSNPSPSCTVCLSDRYRSHSAAEAASGGGSATSLITETL